MVRMGLMERIGFVQLERVSKCLGGAWGSPQERPRDLVTDDLARHFEATWTASLLLALPSERRCLHDVFAMHW